MSKRRPKGERGSRNTRRNLETQFDPSIHTAKEQRDDKPIKALTDTQARYKACIDAQVLTFGVGPAGTGKTYIAVATAAEMLKAGKIKKIIITRPAVEAGENLGFLPGELDEKFDPYFAPVKEILCKRLGTGHVEAYCNNGIIVAKPLAYMRGTTFEDAFVIFDEAQNCTPKQMEMFLTRIGNNTKVVVDGDPVQKDIRGPSGLTDAIKRFSARRWCSMVEFGVEDVVRSGIAKQIVLAYAGREDFEQQEQHELPGFITHEQYRTP